jgi:uncharacterized protein
MLITDCHVHIQPLHMFKPEALALVKKNRQDFVEVEEYCREPKKFLAYMDRIRLDRAVLINYVAPDVTGFGSQVNKWVAEYCKADPERLLSCGSIHPKHSRDVLSEIDNVLRLGLRLIKIHPPHQLLFPNAYLNGCKELELIYRAAESNGVPIMFHTGTSIFPHARNKYGDPMSLDDVALDFPKLKIIMAHGGRPLWMETAFFLLRRHPNVYLDISGIPPKMLLDYFPRLQEIARKTMFGTDWPSRVTDIRRNLDDFRGLDISEPAKRAVLSETALEIWPR